MSLIANIYWQKGGNEWTGLALQCIGYPAFVLAYIWCNKHCWLNRLYLVVLVIKPNRWKAFLIVNFSSPGWSTFIWGLQNHKTLYLIFTLFFSAQNQANQSRTHHSNTEKKVWPASQLGQASKLQATHRQAQNTPISKENWQQATG